MQENTNTHLLMQYKHSQRTKSPKLWASDRIHSDTICYFSDWKCLQASTRTACPHEKLAFMLHTRAATVKTRRYFEYSLQICWGRVLLVSLLSVCRATLNTSSQCVLAAGLTHVSLPLFQMLTLWTGERMNHFKRHPGRQKVYCLSHCSSPTSWKSKGKKKCLRERKRWLQQFLLLQLYAL